MIRPRYRWALLVSTALTTLWLWHEVSEIRPIGDPRTQVEVPAGVKERADAVADLVGPNPPTMHHVKPGDPMSSGHPRPAEPPATAKPIEHIRYWRIAASSGEVYAQCRFALAAQNCAGVIQNYSPWARHRMETQWRAQDPENRLTDCSGVTDSDVRGLADALQQSAERGFTPSQVLYATGIGLGGVPDIKNTDAIRRFRQRAPDLAWKAFSHGDPDAAALLWRVHNEVDVGYVALAGAIDPDPVKAHALDLLMDDLVPDFIVGTAAEAGLSKEQAAQAEALHAEWRATSFAHARPPRFGMEIERMFDPEKRAVELCAPDPR